MFDRETLEQMALEAVCSCLYYDLVDGIESVSDGELIGIIEHKEPCELCGQ